MAPDIYYLLMEKGHHLVSNICREHGYNFLATICVLFIRETTPLLLDSTCRLHAMRSWNNKTPIGSDTIVSTWGIGRSGCSILAGHTVIVNASKRKAAIHTLSLTIDNRHFAFQELIFVWKLYKLFHFLGHIRRFNGVHMFCAGLDGEIGQDAGPCADIQHSLALKTLRSVQQNGGSVCGGSNGVLQHVLLSLGSMGRQLMVGRSKTGRNPWAPHVPQDRWKVPDVEASRNSQSIVDPGAQRRAFRIPGQTSIDEVNTVRDRKAILRSFSSVSNFFNPTQLSIPWAIIHFRVRFAQRSRILGLILWLVEAYNNKPCVYH